MVWGKVVSNGAGTVIQARGDRLSSVAGEQGEPVYAREGADRLLENQACAQTPDLRTGVLAMWGHYSGKGDRGEIHYCKRKKTE